MPTLLRGAIIALSTAVTFVGVGLLAVAAVSTDVDAIGVVLESLAICALTVPPLVAGTFASYWSWDASARTRLRVWMLALLAVQVAGATLAILLTAGSWPLLIGAIVLVMVSAGLDPACVALGRAARRIELRDRARIPVPTGFDARSAGPVELEAFRTAIRSGWRAGAIGGGIGLVVGVLLTTLLLLVGRERSDLALQAVSYIPGGAGLGASFGTFSTVFSLSRRMRDLLGGDYSTARRIGRAVSGKEASRTPEEADRARVYAAVGPRWLRFQTAQTLANLIGVESIAIGSFAGLIREQVPGAVWIAVGFGVLLVVALVLTACMRTIQLGRLRRYAAAHPIPA